MLQTVDEHDPYEIPRQELNGLTIWNLGLP